MAKKQNKAAQAPEAPATVAEAPARDKRNGLTRPAAGTKTGRVWEIADSLTAAQGKPTARADVLVAGRNEGLNDATITTQYGRWRAFNGYGKVGRVTQPAGEAAPAEDAPQVQDDEPEVEEGFDDDEDEEEYEDGDEEFEDGDE